MDLIVIFRILLLNAEEYTFFSSAHGTFSRIDASLVTNQNSVNLRKLKLYQASSLTTTLETRYQLQEKRKLKRKTHALNDTLDEMDLIDIFRMFHPNAEEYTFFSSAHGTFSIIDHILGHKSNLTKFRKI